MNPFYTDYSQFLDSIFPGLKVQKISINTGRSCPNRDGTISRGGCYYCDNASFTPGYCDSALSIVSQLENGKQFFCRKYPDMHFLAYFQAFTSTHGLNAGQVTQMVEQALSQPRVVGAVIATRPDCFPEVIAETFGNLNKKTPIFIEFGAETSFDKTLNRINRGHTWSDTVSAVNRASQYNIRCGIHLIAGLPGETLSDALTTLRIATQLPIDTIKLHQLQIIKGTTLWKQWKDGVPDIVPLQLEDYLNFCEKAVKIIPSHIAIDRFLSQAPPDSVEAPSWGLKNYQFTELLLSRLRTKQLSGTFK